MQAPEEPALELSPTRVDLEPGGPGATLTLRLTNATNVVETYSVEVVGLPSEWVTLPKPTLSLFPGDSGSVDVVVHVPEQPGTGEPTYPFQVVAHARASGTSRSARAEVALRGTAVFSLELAPRRQLVSWGKGRFRVQVANTGIVDGRVRLAATDAEEGCRFQFPQTDEPMVPAGASVEVPLIVEPRQRRWVGPEHVYDLTVTAHPSDGANGLALSVAGSLTWQPRFRSLTPSRWYLLPLAALGLLVGVSALPASARCGMVGNNRAIPVLGRDCAPLVLGVEALGSTAAQPLLAPTATTRPAAASATGGGTATAGGGGATPAVVDPAAGGGGGGGPTASSAGGGGVTAAGTISSIGGGSGGATAGGGVGATSAGGGGGPTGGGGAAGTSGGGAGGGGSAGSGPARTSTPTRPPAPTATSTSAPTATATATIRSTATATATATTTPTAVTALGTGTCTRFPEKPNPALTPTQGPAKKAGDEWSQTDPTTWWLCSSVSADDLNKLVSSGPARLVDLQVDQVQPAYRFTAVLVANTGSYAKSWWWYYGLGDADLTARLDANKARPIALRAYQANGATLFAVVMVADDDQSHATWWYYNADGDLLAQHAVDNKAHLIDLDGYQREGRQEYTGVLLANNTAPASRWSWQRGVTADQLTASLAKTPARVLDLEPLDAKASKFDVLTQACPCPPSWWYVGLTWDDLRAAVAQTGGRAISIATYVADGQLRYAAALIQNEKRP